MQAAPHHAPAPTQQLAGLLAGTHAVFRNEMGLPAVRAIDQMRPGNRALAWLVDKRWFTSAAAVRRHLPVSDPAVVARAVAGLLAGACRERGVLHAAPVQADALLARHAQQLAAPRPQAGAGPADRPTLSRALATIALRLRQEALLVQAVQARHPGLPVPAETLAEVLPEAPAGAVMRLLPPSPARVRERVDAWIHRHLDRVLRHALDGMPELDGARGLGRDAVLSRLRQELAAEAAHPGHQPLRAEVRAAAHACASLQAFLGQQVRAMRYAYLVETLHHSELSNTQVQRANQGESLAAVADDRLTLSEALAIAHTRPDFLESLQALVPAATPPEGKRGIAASLRMGSSPQRPPVNPLVAKAARLAASALATLGRQALQAADAAPPPPVEAGGDTRNQRRLDAALAVRATLADRHGQAAMEALLAVSRRLDSAEREARVLRHLPGLLEIVLGDPATRRNLLARRLEGLLDGSPPAAPALERQISLGGATRAMEVGLASELQSRLLGFEPDSFLSQSVERFRAEGLAEPFVLQELETSLRATLAQDLEHRMRDTKRSVIAVEVLEGEFRMRITQALQALIATD